MTVVGGKIFSYGEIFDENSRRKYLRRKCHQNNLKTPLCLFLLSVLKFYNRVNKEKEKYSGINTR